MKQRFTKFLSSKGSKGGQVPMFVANNTMAFPESSFEEEETGCLNFEFRNRTKEVSTNPMMTVSEQQEIIPQVFSKMGLLTASGETLGVKGILFRAWRRVVFVFDFPKQEIRYYRLLRNQRLRSDSQPSGIIKFDPTDETSKLEIKSIKESYRGRNGVLVLKGDKKGSTVRNGEMVLTFDSPLNLLDWKHRILAITKQDLKPSAEKPKKYFFF